MDTKKLDAIRKALEISLEVIGEAHGVAFDIGKMTYSHSGFRCPLEAFEVSDTGVSADQVKFEQAAHFFDLSPSDYGRVFWMGRDQWKLVGIELKNRKYPIIAEKVGSGKTYKLESRHVQIAIAREDNANA